MTTTGQATVTQPPSPDGREASSLQRSASVALTDAIEGWGWLDAVDGPLQAAAGRLLSGDQRRVAIADLLHGTWLGHPLHPALSDLPIGLWLSAAVAGLAGEDRAAALLTGAGIAAAGVTAASGVADWTGTHGRERRLGIAHALLNSVALGAEVLSLAARRAGRQRTATLLGLAGAGVTAGTAWVGGELTFARGVGVDHTAWTAGPAEWTPVMRIDDLPVGEARGADVEGRRVLLYRDADGVHAMENACAHAGGPLDEGEVARGTVTCPWHGSCFRLTDGAVLHGPATYPQLRLQARVEGGRVEVRGREG